MDNSVWGVIAIAYGAICLAIGLFKVPAVIWNMGKIQGFRNILGDVGTQIFLTVWGLAAVVLGIWLFNKM